MKSSRQKGRHLIKTGFCDNSLCVLTLDLCRTAKPILGVICMCWSELL